MTDKKCEILIKAINEAVEYMMEHECDCPPEWPRCDICLARILLQNALREIK